MNDTKRQTPDWRTKETHEAYQLKIRSGHLNAGCPLCSAESVVEFVHWRLIANDYPYDRVAEIHHMVVPRRHTDGEDLAAQERAELATLLKTDLNTRGYNYFMQSLPNKMSIPSHLHYHLIKARNFE